MEVIQSGRRLLGTYFRVAFYGQVRLTGSFKGSFIYITIAVASTQNKPDVHKHDASDHFALLNSLGKLFVNMKKKLSNPRYVLEMCQMLSKIII